MVFPLVFKRLAIIKSFCEKISSGHGYWTYALMSYYLISI